MGLYVNMPQVHDIPDILRWVVDRGISGIALFSQQGSAKGNRLDSLSYTSATLQAAAGPWTRAPYETTAWHSIVLWDAPC